MGDDTGGLAEFRLNNLKERDHDHGDHHGPQVVPIVFLYI